MVMRIGRSVRSQQGAEQRRKLYGKLLAIGGRVVAQARRFAAEGQQDVRREGLRKQLEDMVERVEQV